MREYMRWVCNKEWAILPLPQIPQPGGGGTTRNKFEITFSKLDLTGWFRAPFHYHTRIPGLDENMSDVDLDACE